MLFNKKSKNKVSQKEILLIVLAMSALAFLFSLYSNPRWFESRLTGMDDDQSASSYGDGCTLVAVSLAEEDDLLGQVTFLTEVPLESIKNVGAWNLFEDQNLKDPNYSGSIEQGDPLPPLEQSHAYQELGVYTPRLTLYNNVGQIIADCYYGPFSIEPANKGPEVKTALTLSPASFTKGELAKTMASVTFTDQDGREDLEDIATLYIFNEKLSLENAIQKSLEEINRPNCKSDTQLPCKTSLTASSPSMIPGTEKYYESNLEFLAATEGEKTALVLVKDKKDKMAYSKSDLAITQGQAANSPPSIVSSNVRMETTDPVVGEVLLVSAEMSATDIDNNLHSFAPMYILDQELRNVPKLSSWAALTEYFEAQGLETNLPSCSANINLPCSVMLQSSNSRNYTRSIEFLTQKAGKKTYLLLAMDDKSATDSVSGTFEVLEGTTPPVENSPPSIVSHQADLLTKTPRVGAPISSSIKMTATDIDNNLETSALMYVLDQELKNIPKLSSRAALKEYFASLGLDLSKLPTCSENTNLPCSLILPESAAGLIGKTYASNVKFLTQKAGKKTYLILAIDDKLATDSVSGTFEVLEGTTPPVENSPPSIVSHQADLLTKTPRVGAPISSSVKVNANDLDNNLKAFASMYVLDQELKNVPKLSSWTALTEYFASLGLQTNLTSCSEKINLPCSIILPESGVGLVGKTYASNVKFLTQKAGQKTYLILAVDDKLATDSVSGTFEVLEGTTPPPPVTPEITLNLSIPLQDRDTNPASDRGDHSTEVWFGLYRNTAANPIYTSKLTTNVEGKASLVLTDMTVGNYIAVVKTSQHLSKGLNVNLVAGENPVNFSYLLAGDIAGSKNSLATNTFDDEVNSIDIGEVYLYWGTKRGQANYNYLPDLDSNGEVGAEDFSTLISNAGRKGYLKEIASN